MEPPAGDDGVNPHSKSSFSDEDFKNYMGFKSVGNTQTNPFYLNLTYSDDPDLTSKINAMNVGNADRFRSRASQRNTGAKKTQKYTTEEILKQLNSVDFESVMKERSQEKPTEATQSNSRGPTNEQVDLRNVHLFNMPPSMRVPDSDDEELDDIYKTLDQPPNYKFQSAKDFRKFTTYLLQLTTVLNY